MKVGDKLRKIPMTTDGKVAIGTKKGKLQKYTIKQILEHMMVALSIRMEKDIMEDLRYGDRTSQWFWTMVNNLGLGSMTDSKFNEEEADYIIDRFINHNYEPNGKGGLFIVDGDEDLRDEEIWVQMCWYINTLEE